MANPPPHVSRRAISNDSLQVHEPGSRPDTAVSASRRGPQVLASVPSVPILEVVELSKIYPGTQALRSVNLEVRPGEIHALCGGNGSGKSTLIKILCGVVDGEPGGQISINGVNLDAAKINAKQAHDLGVRVVHQDLGVFPDMTVAENFALGAEFQTDRFGRINWHRQHELAMTLIERFEIDASPRDLVRNLSIGVRTQIAIARAMQDSADLSRGLLVLDEPTAALPSHEVGILFSTLKRLVAKGLGILYVSHRLDEVLEMSDRVTVLRDGVRAACVETRTLDTASLVRHLLGARADSALHAPANSAGSALTEQEPVLAVEGLWAGPVRDVDLVLRPGEVVGVAGVLGSGRTELLRALFGDLAIERGTIRLQGQPVRFTNIKVAMKHGVAMVPENRAVDAVFPDQSVMDNATVAVLSDYWRRGTFRRKKLRSDGRELLTSLQVKAPSGDVAMASLSGGNQQKVIMARWLRRNPCLLLLDEPTQGVDVGARAEIYALVRQAAAAGNAVLLVASDLEELALVADRAIVMRAGRVVAHVPKQTLSGHLLTELSTSGELETR